MAIITCRHCCRDSEPTDDQIRQLGEEFENRIARVRSEDWSKFKAGHSKELFRFRFWEYLSIFQFFGVMLLLGFFPKNSAGILVFLVSAFGGVGASGWILTKRNSMFQAWRKEQLSQGDSSVWEGTMGEHIS